MIWFFCFSFLSCWNSTVGFDSHNRNSVYFLHKPCKYFPPLSKNFHSFARLENFFCFCFFFRASQKPAKYSSDRISKIYRAKHFPFLSVLRSQVSSLNRINFWEATFSQNVLLSDAIPGLPCAFVSRNAADMLKLLVPPPWSLPNVHIWAS